MKKSVLIALLGLSTTEGMKINQKDDNESSQTQTANGDGNNNANNTTQALAQTGFEMVQTIANLESKQDDFDHQQEMDEADEDAESVVQEADSADDDSGDEALTGINADVDGAPAATAAAAGAAPALAAAAPAPAVKGPKNKDSSDEECACAPSKESTKQKASIKAKQEKRLAEAKAAKAAATAAKAAAEEAIAAANLAKRTGAKNVLELAKAAEDAISAATVAENKSIERQTAAKSKVSVNKSEGFDLKTKMVVKTWEETVVSKHEIWETYKSIKKNFRIAVTNVKLVRQNLKAAENKVVQIRKTSALNPKDIGAHEKIKEAEELVTVIRKQLLDAENQKTKIKEEMEAAQTKARESSVASAKAKSQAEKAFRNMVIDNNKTCSACRLGKEKIAKRRLEIDGAIKQETKLKAQREAEKRRQSRGRGGRRTDTAATAGLAQQTQPVAGPALTQPMPVPTALPQAQRFEPIAVAQESRGNEKQTKKSHKKHKPVQEEPASGDDSQGDESN